MNSHQRRKHVRKMSRDWPPRAEAIALNLMEPVEIVGFDWWYGPHVIAVRYVWNGVLDVYPPRLLMRL